MLFRLLIACAPFFILASPSQSFASGNVDSRRGSENDPLQRLTTDLCDRLLRERDRRAFTRVEEDGAPAASERERLWSDFNQLLERSTEKSFHSMDRSIGVASRVLGRISWMLPNEALQVKRPDFLPELPGTLKPIAFEEHLENLKLLRSKIQDPSLGLFGPHSVLWRVVGVSGDLLNFGAVNFLQLTHPAGAQGVYEHSKLFSDPMERMKQTARYIYKIIYDPWEDVQKISIGVFKGHSRVQGVMPESIAGYREGQSYAALDPEALLWVYSTRFMSWLEAYDVLSDRPLNDYEREQAFQESKLFAMVFGIPLNVLPRTFADFYHYYQFMLRDGRLAVGPIARATQEHFEGMGQKFVKSIVAAEVLTANYLSIGPTLLLSHVINKGIKDQAAFYLPDRFRNAYGIGSSQLEIEIAMRASKSILVDHLKPRGLLVLPAYAIAQARVRGIEVDPEVLQRHYLMTGEKR